MEYIVAPVAPFKLVLVKSPARISLTIWYQLPINLPVLSWEYKPLTWFSILSGEPKAVLSEILVVGSGFNHSSFLQEPNDNKRANPTNLYNFIFFMLYLSLN